MTAAKSFVATLRVKPEKREEFVSLQTELKHLVAAHEPDALVYELLQSDDDKNLFFCVATFKDDAAFEHHMHIDFHDRLVPPVMECLASDMEIGFFRSLS